LTLRALIVVPFVIFVADSTCRVLDTNVFAQADVTDTELQRASSRRTVALRVLAGGSVANVPLEIYVARVLAGEAEPGAPEATMQALAVAIRTFAIFNAGRHARDGFDLCDTTHCQVPRPSNADTRRAALATAGRILTYGGAPAEIFYSASCGGRSESAAAVWPRSNLPYLRAVEDDVHDDDVPWQLERSIEEIARALERAGFAGRLTGVEITDRTESGRVARLKVSGLRPDVVTGEQFRAALGNREMQSTAFAIRKRGDALTFTGRGYGHGVGMCVIGAGRRARRGETVGDILAHYYPALDVSSLGSVPPARIDTATASAATAVARAASPLGVTVRVPTGSPVTASDVDRVAAGARSVLSKTLGLPASPVTIQLHPSLDSFRNATNQPWWVSAVVSGTTIDVAPPVLIAQRDGIEAVLRVALAEQLVAPSLAGRPAWVTVGAARYFARQVAGAAAAGPSPSGSLQCPSDAELRLSISAAAQRDAESRAEACFTRGYAQTRDWRAVR
jgi:SpoIID/LytB domain protein